MDTLERLSTIDEMIAIVEGRVEGKAWVKGSDATRIERDGQPVVGMCLGGMARYVISTSTGTRMVPSGPWSAFDGDPLFRMIGQVILEQYGDRIAEPAPAGVQIPPHHAIVPFNDHHETTPEEIVRVLEKTRVKIAESV